MLVSGRRLMVAACGVIVLIGVVLMVRGDLAGPALALTLIAGGLIGILLLSVLFRPPSTTLREESDDIMELGEERRRELIRGTSMYLREMQYRYSIRVDASASPKRACFAAEVNTIRLGFIPAIITDNTNDRQGYGYVAFVHDGKRWRGPGLPCPDDQVQAVQHAARCVSPLSTEDETHFEGSTAG